MDPRLDEGPKRKDLTDETKKEASGRGEFLLGEKEGRRGRLCFVGDG